MIQTNAFLGFLFWGLSLIVSTWIVWRWEFFGLLPGTMIGGGTLIIVDIIDLRLKSQELIAEDWEALGALLSYIFFYCVLVLLIKLLLSSFFKNRE
jgi:hypothetical protein